MSDVKNLSRRHFLETSVLAGGGLVLGVFVPAFQTKGEVTDKNEGGKKKVETFAPNAFVRIGSDESVTVVVNHSEMGQGIYTGLSMLVAEELDADWSKVRAEAAPVDAAYNHALYGIQLTGGSTSTWTEWKRMRQAGAVARAMLIATAAETWKVPKEACRAENGFVIHDASGRRLSFGGLAERASLLTPPRDVPLKDPKDFNLVGRSTKRLDTPEKVNGAGIFGMDVTLPGMLVAVVARPPVFGARAKGWNAERAKAVQGVRQIIQIDRGIAVVGDGFWPAKRGRDLLEITWEEGPLAGLDTQAQRRQYSELAGSGGRLARKDGDAAAALEIASRRLGAVYELPYLAHAPMEPLNCVADVRADGCDVWTGTQSQTTDRAAAAQAARLRPDQVRVHTTLLGGGFGRRAALDSHFVQEAVQISRAVKAPVKVIWTREDDLRGGYYRPAAHHAIRAALAPDGTPVGWEHRIVCQSFIVGTALEAGIVKEGVDETAVEGAADLPYDIPNVSVAWQNAPEGVPVLWWRSVGHSHSAFVVESFLDELAHAAGKDPYEYRRMLLAKHPRHLRVLECAAREAGWGQPLATGRGRGIALHESFGSFVAHVAEVSVSNGGKVRVHRVVCAIDCGPVVNPDGVRAQMESGVVFGLTAALYGEITFERGRVKQRNFHDYPMLRMNEMPVVEVHIVPSTDRMGGVGETGVPPIAPAVTNAIFALTGKRARRLPIRAEDLKTG
jgi:isoquinoline 1-oxidoreductase beta subunit